MEQAEIDQASEKKYNLREPNIVNYNDNNNKNLHFWHNGGSSFSGINSMASANSSKRRERNRKRKRKRRNKHRSKSQISIHQLQKDEMHSSDIHIDNFKDTLLKIREAKINNLKRFEEEKQIAKQFIHQRVRNQSYNGIPEHIKNTRTIPIPWEHRPILPKIEVQESGEVQNHPSLCGSGLKMKGICSEHKPHLLSPEITITESSLQKISLNEIVHLNSLSGRIEQMPMYKMESIQRIARDDFLGRSSSNYELCFMPVKIASEYKSGEMFHCSPSRTSRTPSDDFQLNSMERFGDNKYRNSSHQHRRKFNKF